MSPCATNPVVEVTVLWNSGDTAFTLTVTGKAQKFEMRKVMEAELR